MKKNELQTLMQNIGYQFKDDQLLTRALSHRSSAAQNNERLEFLGDAVLGMVIAEQLFLHHPQSREGELSRLRSSLVNREMLAILADDLQLNDYIRLGAGEKRGGGARRNSILSDAVEAIIGAIYMDSDYATCQACILSWFDGRIDDFAKLEPVKDAKSALQEWLQARKLPLPDYTATTTGKSHEQTFFVVCSVSGIDFTTEGQGKSRRKAEQLAAQHFLDKLNEQ